MILRKQSGWREEPQKQEGDSLFEDVLTLDNESCARFSVENRSGSWTLDLKQKFQDLEVRIRSIASDFADFEMSFLQLVDKLTNGTRTTVNETGTGVYFQPGILIGGIITHECDVGRGIGYFLEALIWVAPFCKNPLSITLSGVTNNEQDTSVDLLRTVTMPLLRHFGIVEGALLKITKRGAPPLGGGEVSFKCPVLQELKAVQLTEEGKIRRIRGIA